MKVADFIMKKLYGAGITHAFLVQGGANNDLIYAAEDAGMKYVCAGHEQCAGFMAEGWSKVLGKAGLAIATSGPGAQNLLTAIANCYYDSVPAIFITGQVNSKYTVPEGSGIRQVGFQECDIVSMAKPITKDSVRLGIKSVEYDLDYALWLCREGRPGPVLLDIPMDVQRAEILEECPLKFMAPCASSDAPYSVRRERVLSQVHSFLDDLKQAKRPVMLIGGGVRGEGGKLSFDRLANLLRVPAFPTWNALDIVTSDHHWYGGRIGTYGGAGRNLAVQQCDLLLAIGCRLSGRITGGAPHTFAPDAKRYVVDIDPAMLDPATQQQPFHENIECDADDFMNILSHELEELLLGIPGVDYSSTFDMRQLSFQALKSQSEPPPWYAWNGQVWQWRAQHDPVRRDYEAQEKVHPYVFARVLSVLCPPNAVVLADCGGNVVTMSHAFETKRGQRFITNNGNSPMGFSIAAAIGAWFADPRRPIICVIGDGGFAMNVQELATLKMYGANVKVFVLNNHCYGITRAYQETNGKGRVAASTKDTGVMSPDVLALSRAYGLPCQQLSLTENTQSAIYASLLIDGPFITDVDIGDHHEYVPRIVGWDTPIHKQIG